MIEEWDLDAYVRRWHQTIGFFNTPDNPNLVQCRYGEFFDIDKKHYGVNIRLGTNDDEKSVSVNKPSKKYPMIQIQYHPIAAGWYHSIHGAAMLQRNHEKDYRVGLNEHTHRLMVVDLLGGNVVRGASFISTSFLTRPTYVKYDPEKPFGILSDRVWWKDGCLRFLGRTLGYFRNSGKTLVLDDQSIAKHVAPLLGDKCQISLL